MLHDPFREHLACLVAEYDNLDDENRHLKALLAQNRCSHEVADVEMRLPKRVVQVEAAHGVAPALRRHSVACVTGVVPAPPAAVESPSPPGVVSSWLKEPSRAERAHMLSSRSNSTLPESTGSNGTGHDSTGTPVRSQSPGSPGRTPTRRRASGEEPRKASKILCENADEEEEEHANKAGSSLFGRGKAVFADAEEMKTKIREQLLKPAYNVMDFYKKEGWCQAVARHFLFETITLVVIGANAVWIAVDTDHNEAELLYEAHPVFQVAEHFFCTYFTMELATRFGAFERKRNCLRDAWFVFDAALVTMMVLETWVVNFTTQAMSSGSDSGSSSMGNASILRIARLLRLTRMARMARLLRAMPELLILIKGMAAAARSVFFTLVLLCVLLYVFAIAMTQMIAGDGAAGSRYFNTVPESMHTLWVYGALLDSVGLMSRELLPSSILCFCIFQCFVFLAALTLMNMLVGVLCEVVSAVASSEKESMTLNMVKHKVKQIFNDLGLDANGDGMISKEEFQQVIQNPQASRAIHDMGVNVEMIVDMADVFFPADKKGSGNKELTFGEFMDLMVQMRGTNFSTVKDLVNTQNVLKCAIDKQHKLTEKIAQFLEYESGADGPDEQDEQDAQDVIDCKTSKTSTGSAAGDARPQWETLNSPDQPCATGQEAGNQDGSADVIVQDS